MDPEGPAGESVPTPDPTTMSVEAALNSVVDKLTGWADSFVLMLPNLLIALLIVIATWFVARWISRTTSRVTTQIGDNRQLDRLVSITTRVGVMLAGLFLALSVMQLDKTVTSLLAGVGVAGIALGFAFQDIAANFMSGVMMASTRPFAHGDHVEVNGVQGTVETTNLRSVLIRSFSGEIVLVPNKDVLQNALVNYTRGDRRRVEFTVGVGYDTDIEHADSIIQDVVASEHTVEDQDIDVLVEEFGGSSINLKVRFWISATDEVGLPRRKDRAMRAVKSAFADEGIDIPFPIRTLSLDDSTRDVFLDSALHAAK